MYDEKLTAFSKLEDSYKKELDSLMKESKKNK